MNKKWTILTIFALLVMLLGGNVTPAQAAEGDLDTTFGTNGQVITNLSPVMMPMILQHTTVQQSDGKIIVGGYVNPLIEVDYLPQAELVRYSADGVLDTTFGTDGKVDPMVPGASLSFITSVYTGSQDEVIAVGGYGTSYSMNGTFLARYTSEGTPLEGFGTDGVLPIALPTGVAFMIPISSALQNDGMLLVSGLYSITNQPTGTFLLRLNLEDGTYDTSFGTDGILLSTDYILASLQILPQSDGKFLSFSAASLMGDDSLRIRRYSSTGELDESFGMGGEFEIPFMQPQCGMLAETVEGKIYLTVGPSQYSTASDFLLLRLNADGSLDDTFGVGGGVQTDFDGSSDQSCGLLIQSDGKVIVGGGAMSDGMPFVGMVRYTSDGVLDESFGSAGKVLSTDVSGAIVNLALTPNGKLLVTGVNFESVDFNLFTILARYDLTGIQNTAPVANPGGPYLGPVNTAISFDGSGSSDLDGNPLTYAWTFDDGATGTGATPTHSYGAAGVYDVCLTVNDGMVDSPQVCTLAVVYDPNAGFVTGGGWINSPAGAYLPNLELSGKAAFGFVSKYLKGATVPTGNTEFQFQAGSFKFHSTAYEWLVISKTQLTAQYKGSGTVNGAMDPNGNAYKFMLWAGDGTPDTFRIRIWWEADGIENVVYDNGFNQAIEGGSIVVHK